MRFLVIFVSLFLTTSVSAYDWGKTGHRTTGAIAEKHLTKKAKRAIDKLLNGESLAFVSTYADEIKSDQAYRAYGAWHYVNVPFESNYHDHPKSERGDIIVGIEKCVQVLKDDSASTADKAFSLRLLVHLIGDLHQPLHVGLGKDKGGNDFQVRWYDEGTNLHSVWDTKMIESYNMSYTELSDNAPTLSKNQVAALQMGTTVDWMEDSRVLVKDIYKNTESGEKLGYRYMYDYFNTLRNQLQKGGVRLAGMLNELFG